MSDDATLTGPMAGAEHQAFGPVEVDTMRVGNGRIKRLVYPPGLRWSVDLRPLVGTELCEHTHVGFRAQGGLEGVYPTAARSRTSRRRRSTSSPGHDAWVTGDEAAVLIQLDFEGRTTETLGLPARHGHD
jgi:hypothetical protein